MGISLDEPEPNRLTYREEIDLAAVLFANWEAIAVAYYGGAPHLFSRAFGQKLDAIRAVGAVLDIDLKLCAPFKTVLDAQLGGRRQLNDVTFDDCHQLAIRVHEWHNEPFRDDWSIIVYRSR